MNIQFTPRAWKQLNYWISNDKKKVQKINDLLRSIQITTFKGLGSPEPLRHELKGFWSRRIDSEHRLVYRIKPDKSQNEIIEVVQCRFHY